MHRLISVTAIAIITALTSVTAEATDSQHKDWVIIQSMSSPDAGSPGNIQRKGAGPQRAKEERKKCFTNQFDTDLAQRCARNLRRSRIASVQWAPGLQSSNLKIKRVAQRRGRRGETTLGDIVCVKQWDKSSAFLKRAHKSRRRIPVIILKGRDGRGRPMMIKLSDVIISSYQTGGSAHGGPLPSEEITLGYTKAEWTY